MRVGRPRTSWIIEAAKAAWEKWGLEGQDGRMEEGQLGRGEFKIKNDSDSVKKLIDTARARGEEKKRK